MGTLLGRALALPFEERAAFLDRECEGKAVLRAEVEARLESAAASAGMFEERGEIVETGELAGPDADASSGPVAHLGVHSQRRVPGPTLIGPYRVLEYLDKGGFGDVYFCQDPRPPRTKLAVKVLRKGLDTKEVLARFEAEQNALRLMSHPAIVKVFESGETDTGQPYFAMEYVDGKPITAFCSAERLSLRNRLQLFVDVCKAVQHAHSKACIHRDLKPGNILVTRIDGKPAPKIIDFGLVKAISQPLTDRTLHTSRRQVMGTWEYMSPEQARSGGTDVDTLTDVYALGAILYELCCGELAFPGLRDRPDSEILRTVAEVDPPRPSRRFAALAEAQARQRADELRTDRPTLLRKLRKELDWIVFKAMRKQRGERYESPLALAADVQCYLDGTAVHARPASTSYQVQKFVRKHQALVTGTLLVILALTTGLGWAVLERHRAEQEKTRAVLAQAQAERDREAAVAARNEAEEQRMTIAAQRDEIQQWADPQLLLGAKAAADGVYSMANLKDQARALRSWLGEYGYPLEDRLPIHRASLVRLRARADSHDGRGDQESWRFLDAKEQTQHDRLAQLVAGFERFLDPDPQKGTLSSVEARLKRAEKMAESWTHRWRDAIAEIRQLEVYDGLELTPQAGLVPLRRNRQGLWEFWHVETGEEPQANPDADGLNEWTLTEATGVVLVLIPGGSFWMGAQAHDPMGHNYDPEDNQFGYAMSGTSNNGLNLVYYESPVTVTLDSYFASKYELTQAQWKRMTGEDPSAFESENKPLNPVESVSWEDCVRCLGQARFELELPTEAQWERAARGMTEWPYWCGSSAESIAQVQAGRISFSPGDWVDGMSAIGSYRANPFGLHDTIGNVWEWCRDGDGDRYLRGCRGGSFLDQAPIANSACRRFELRDCSYTDLGVRPARAIR
ncbi:MAG: protein kinase [Planctomycetota bacterium]